MTRRSPLWKTAFALAGAFPLLTLYPAFLLGSLINSQAGLLRTAGTFGVAAGLGAALALALAGLNQATQVAERPLVVRLLTAGYFAGLLANVFAIGLALQFRSAGLAPPMYKAGAALAVLALTINLLRAEARDREAVTAMTLGVGKVVLVTALACLPVAAIAAANDVVELPGRPALPAAPALRADAPQRIVLVTFDGLRARSTSLATPALDTTPNLARLARQAIQFPNFRPAGDQTIVSVPSILTGISPVRLYAGIRHRSGALREGSIRSVAAYLRSAGYRTHYETMFIQPAVFAVGADFDEGKPSALFLPPVTFNTREYLPLAPAAAWLRERVIKPRHPGGSADDSDALRSTQLSLERARAALERGDGKVFTWVHLGVPHAPFYDVPKSALGRELRKNQVRKVYPNGSLPPERVAEFERPMENYIRFGDHELGRFIAALEASPAWPRTLLIVTSDHGAEFLPVGDIHGNGLLTEDVAHVPLLVHEPGRTTPARDAAPAGHVDIVPTILERVFEAVPAGFDGTPLLGRRPTPDTTAFVWGLYGRQAEGRTTPANVAAYAGTFKFVLSKPAGAGALYDLSRDPRATRDVTAAHLAVAAKLRERTERFLRGEAPHAPAGQGRETPL